MFPPKNENNIKKKKICPILPQFLKICKYYIQLLILISVETETLRIKNQEKTEHKWNLKDGKNWKSKQDKKGEGRLC